MNAVASFFGIKCQQVGRFTQLERVKFSEFRRHFVPATIFFFSASVELMEDNIIEVWRTL